MAVGHFEQIPYQFTEGEPYLQQIAARFGDEAQITSEPVQIVGRSQNQKAVYQVLIAVPSNKPKQAKSFAANAYEQNDGVEISFSKQALELAQKSEQKKSEQKKSEQNTPNAQPILEFKEHTNHQNRLSSKETLQMARRYEKSRAAANSTISDQLLKEVAKLRAQVDSMSEMRWGELAASRSGLDIPKEFAAIYNRARSSGMSMEHLDAIMLATKKNLPRAMYSNTEAIYKYFHNFLASMIPCRVDSLIRKQKIIMLIGPTGVGKTTTLAKLAYKYRYCEPRYNVAIISLDDFRLGAKEQLAEYASLMRIPLRYISANEDFSAAIDELAAMDVVLIDSTGNSQYDKSKISKLESYLNSTKAQIDATLVLSAGMKYEDMKDAFTAFDELKIDSLIFTKFDESKSFGNIFSLVYETKKPVSFFSIGQNVPDDIMSADKKFLATCLLKGFEKEEYEK